MASKQTLLTEVDQVTCNSQTCFAVKGNNCVKGQITLRLTGNAPKLSNAQTANSVEVWSIWHGAYKFGKM